MLSCGTDLTTFSTGSVLHLLEFAPPKGRICMGTSPLELCSAKKYATLVLLKYACGPSAMPFACTGVTAYARSTPPYGFLVVVGALQSYHG